MKPRSAAALVAALLASGSRGPLARRARRPSRTATSRLVDDDQVFAGRRGYRITDKDREAGYVLFVYPGDGAVKECAASLELLRVVDEAGLERVRLQLSIASQPSYIEVHLLDQLEQKIIEEQGRRPAAEAPREGTRREGAARAEPLTPAGGPRPAGHALPAGLPSLL